MSKEDESQKVFNICFRTVPMTNNGVTHILGTVKFRFFSEPYLVSTKRFMKKVIERFYGTFLAFLYEAFSGNSENRVTKKHTKPLFYLNYIQCLSNC